MTTVTYPKYDTLPQILPSRGDPDMFTPRGYNPASSAANNPASMSMPTSYMPGSGSLLPVPFGGNNQIANQKFNSAVDDSSRSRALEVRLLAAEQSNRAVLEEVVRLQNEMRSAIRTLEHNYRGELSERANFDQSVKSSTQNMVQLAAKVQQIEQTLEQGQSSVNNLANQVKKVEQNLMTAQRDVLQRNDTYFSRLNNVSQSVEEWSGERAKMQGALSLLSNEVKALKHALGIKALEYQTLQQEIQKRNAQLQNESQSMVDYFRKTQDHKSDSEYQQQQLRSNVESRLLEIRDSLIELRNRSMKEETERRNIEQNLGKKLSEQHTQIADQSRVIEDLRHELVRLSSSTNQAFDRERIDHNDRVLKSEDETKRKMHSMELNVKNELMQRISEFEKTNQAEKEHRLAAEKIMRDETQTALNEMQKKIDADMIEVKKKMKADKSKFSSAYSEMNRSVELIDRKQSESFDKLSRALKAEISSREAQDKHISSKGDELNHRLGTAIKSFQTSISALESKYKDLKDDYQKEMDDIKTEVQLSVTRSIGDLDVRMETLNNKLKDVKSKFEVRLTESEQLQAENSAKMTQQLSQWHEQITVRVNDLHDNYSRLKPMVVDLQSQFGNFRLEANSRLDKEQETRIQEMEKLRQDVHSKMANVPSKFQVDQLEEAINSHKDDLDLALMECHRIREGFETLQQSCDSRLSDETNTRAKQIVDVNERISKLKKLIDAYSNPKGENNGNERRPENELDPPKINSPSSSNPDPERWQDTNA